MKIIISPAKKMNVDTDTFPWKDIPVYRQETEALLAWMRTLTYEESRKLWGCNEKLAKLNYERIRDMDLDRNLTAALISYEGIQYQYMAPSVFTQKQWDYVQEHLRILSGFYGVVRPLDGVVPYRLEMQAKAKAEGTKNLYEFWGDKLYRQIRETDCKILNLASKEYSKCIESYLQEGAEFLTCIFGEWKNGKVIQKGTQAKMARGEMVRFLAEEGIEEFQDVKDFRGLGYCYEGELSSDREYVFVKQEGNL